MELEKSLFRIHEKVLSQEGTLPMVRFIKWSFLAVGSLLLLLFFYANAAHRTQTGCLGQIYEQFKKEQLNETNGIIWTNDTVLYLNVCDYNKTAQPSPMMFYNYSRYDPVIIVKEKTENNTKKEEKLLNETATDQGDKEKGGDNNQTVNIDNEDKKDDIDNDKDAKEEENKKDDKEPKRFIAEDDVDNEVDEDDDIPTDTKQSENDNSHEDTNDPDQDDAEGNDSEPIPKDKTPSEPTNNSTDANGTNSNSTTVDSPTSSNITSSNNKTTTQAQQTPFTPPIPYYLTEKRLLRNECLTKSRIQLEYSSVNAALTYPKEYMAAHNIRTVVAYIEPTCYASWFLQDFIIFHIIGIEPILINEIIENFKSKTVLIRNPISEEAWGWAATTISIIQNTSTSAFIVKLMVSSFRIALGFFYASAISALYIKISIICSPVFIFLIMECMRCAGSSEVSVSTLTQSFPHLGLYLNALGNHSKTELIKSFLKMMLVVYFIYLSGLFVGSFILFSKSLPKGLDENFLAFIAVLELLCLLFVRTRSSLKWFPRFAVLLMAVFVYYLQNTVYGYYSLLLFIMTLFVIAIFAFMLETFEIPALYWNESHHYTPSLHRPRCMYFPLFNIGWVYDLPQLWTMFYPLYGREHFTQEQLSIVDNNYPLLNQTLQQAELAHNGGGAIEQVQRPNENNNQQAQQQANQQQQQPQMPADNQNNNVQPQPQQSSQQQLSNNAFEMNSMIPSHLHPLVANDIEMQAGVNSSQEENLLDSDELTGNSKSRERNLLDSDERTTNSKQFYQGRGIQIGGGGQMQMQQSTGLGDSQMNMSGNNHSGNSMSSNNNNNSDYQKLQ